MVATKFSKQDLDEQELFENDKIEEPIFLQNDDMIDSVIENNKNPVCETEINYEENAVQITDASVIQDTV